MTYADAEIISLCCFVGGYRGVSLKYEWNKMNALDLIMLAQISAGAYRYHL